MKDAHDSALEKAPDILHAVGMHVASGDVGLSVFYGLVANSELSSQP